MTAKLFRLTIDGYSGYWVVKAHSDRAAAIFLAVTIMDDVALLPFIVIGGKRLFGSLLLPQDNESQDEWVARWQEQLEVNNGYTLSFLAELEMK